MHGIEANKSLMDSMSALHQKKNSITRQQAFTGDDCPGATSRPFSGNGLTSGHSSTHCYVTEYDSGNVETYFQSSPDGSYSTGFFLDV
ncbi:hypothetical protein QW180_22200 [Vibrio sinaloensis]|nr:hypothetical protein [Vibrio sinaloensis]